MFMAGVPDDVLLVVAPVGAVDAREEPEVRVFKDVLLHGARLGGGEGAHLAPVYPWPHRVIRNIQPAHAFVHL